MVRESAGAGRLVRVLWLSHSSSIGGAELALAEGASALARRGHEVHVMLPHKGPLTERLGPARGVHIVHSNRWTYSREGLAPGVVGKLRWMLYNLAVGRVAVSQMARTVAPDVIVSNTITIPTGALAALSCGLPHAWFLHEFGAKEHDVHFILGRRLTLAAMDYLAHGFMVNSETMARTFGRVFDPERISVVPYAVDVPEVRNIPTGSRTSLEVVLVGMKCPGKGQREAIAATGTLARRGVDVRMKLIGDSAPNYEGQLRELSEALGVAGRVTFVPFEEDPFRAMAAADVVLTCSRMEGFGRVVVEGMKLGRAVVGACSGATSELIRNGWNGLLYPPGDATALARCLEDLYRDRGMARRFGERGREWALKRFNFETYGRRLEEALVEVMARGTLECSHGEGRRTARRAPRVIRRLVGRRTADVVDEGR